LHLCPTFSDVLLVNARPMDPWARDVTQLVCFMSSVPRHSYVRWPAKVTRAPKRHQKFRCGVQNSPPTRAGLDERAQVCEKMCEDAWEEYKEHLPGPCCEAHVDPAPPVVDPPKCSSTGGNGPSRSSSDASKCAAGGGRAGGAGHDPFTARGLVEVVLQQPTTTAKQADALLRLLAAHEDGRATKEAFLADLKRQCDPAALRGALRALAAASSDAQLKEKVCGQSAADGSACKSSSSSSSSAAATTAAAASTAAAAAAAAVPTQSAPERHKRRVRRSHAEGSSSSSYSSGGSSNSSPNTSPPRPPRHAPTAAAATAAATAAPTASPAHAAPTTTTSGAHAGHAVQGAPGAPGSPATVVSDLTPPPAHQPPPATTTKHAHGRAAKPPANTQPGLLGQVLAAFPHISVL
jgi:hypothetical protein